MRAWTRSGQAKSSAPIRSSRGRRRRLGHVGHVRVLQRPQLVGELVGAESSCSSKASISLAVDALADPLALGAAPPDPPVGAVAGLLPAGRLDQARAAAGQMCNGRGATGSSSSYRTLRADPSTLRKRRNPLRDQTARSDPAALHPVTMGKMPGNIGPLEIAIVLIIALLVFGPKRLPELGQQPRPRHPRVQRLDHRRAATTTTTTTTRRRGAAPPAVASRPRPTATRPRPRSSATRPAEAAPGWPAASGRSPTRIASPWSSTSTSCARG